jgi:hypothetical protein
MIKDLIADDRLTSNGRRIAFLIVHKLSESTASPGFDPWSSGSLVREGKFGQVTRRLEKRSGKVTGTHHIQLPWDGDTLTMTI